MRRGRGLSPHVDFKAGVPNPGEPVKLDALQRVSLFSQLGGRQLKLMGGA